MDDSAAAAERAALVDRAARGDRGAWAAIWDEHAPALHRYARRLLDQDSDAADAVADTFVAAAEHLGQLRDPLALRPWLYSICKRQVQRQWRDRDRMRPMEHDVLTAIGDADQSMSTELAIGLDAAEAATLIWEAAEGLTPADRELLALTLANDLDSASVARIAGVSAQSIHVKVSRLRDSLGKAAGALLVARRHRSDCDALRDLLADWDGRYSTVWRKRIARHVEGCPHCTDRQAAAAGALFALAPIAPVVLPSGLRESVLDRVSAITGGGADAASVNWNGGGDWGGPAAGARSAAAPPAALHSSDFGPDGFAAAQPWEQEQPRRRRRFLLAALAAVLLVTVAGALLRPWAPTETAGQGAPLGYPISGAPAGPTAAATPSLAPPTTVPTTAEPAPESTAAPTPTPSPSTPQPPIRVTPVPTPTAPTGEPAPPPGTATLIPLPPPVLPAPPLVRVRVAAAEIIVGCGTPRATTATATWSGTGVTTVMSWSGSNAGSAPPYAGASPHSVRIGPFPSASPPPGSGTETITVTATATDAFGRTATASVPLAVTIAPC